MVGSLQADVDYNFPLNLYVSSLLVGLELYGFLPHRLSVIT